MKRWHLLERLAVTQKPARWKMILALVSCKYVHCIVTLQYLVSNASLPSYLLLLVFIVEFILVLVLSVSYHLSVSLHLFPSLCLFLCLSLSLLSSQGTGWLELRHSVSVASKYPACLLNSLISPTEHYSMICTHTSGM